MDGEQSIAALEGLLADKGKYLLRTAMLLAGSRSDGEDLLQTALERVIKRWRTISGDPEPYLRRTLYHLAIDSWRHKTAWRTHIGLLPESGAVCDAYDVVDQRDRVVRLLQLLPPRQRAAVVLRYWEDLSEAEAATAMNCSVGTVKSATSRGLSRLRELMAAAGQSPADSPDGANGRQTDVQAAGKAGRAA
jgi:RNA polymerase sigma-70 factor (sigma-E family)